MKQNKETLKQFFETGDKPTQQQYADLIDSYIDSKQEAGEANRRFVIDETGEVSVASEQLIPEYTLSPISGTNTVDLLKNGMSVSQIDLTPYLDNTNLARLVSGTVDSNGLATFTRDDNSTFTVDLSNLKDVQVQADWNNWENLSFNNINTTATRARWRKKGNLVHIEIVTLSIPEEGFVATLPAEAKPANSYYGTGSDNNGNVYGVLVNALGGIYVHSTLMKNCTLFFYID